MNNLSWLIYLAELVGNVSVATALLAGFSGAAAMIIGMPMSEQHTGNADWKRLSNWRVAYISIALTLGTISVILPSRMTVMLIAASEYGEKLSETETADKAVNAINKWIDDYLDPPERERR